MTEFNGDGNPNEIVAEEGDDTLNGLGGNDTLSGLGGNDTLRGGENDDSLNGGDGNDSLFGEDGEDKLNGAAGDDTVSGGAGDDDVQGGTGTDGLRGGPDNDRFIINKGDNFDSIQDYDDDGNDTIQIGGFSQITSFADLIINAGTGSSVIDLGLVENGTPGVHVLTVVDENALAGVDFTFSPAPETAADELQPEPPDDITIGTMGVSDSSGADNLLIA